MSSASTPPSYTAFLESEAVSHCSAPAYIISVDMPHILLVYNETVVGAHEIGRKMFLHTADGLAGQYPARTAAHIAVCVGRLDVRDIFSAYVVYFGMTAGYGEEPSGNRSG